jgi:hypothetical protein
MDKASDMVFGKGNDFRTKKDVEKYVLENMGKFIENRKD